MYKFGDNTTYSQLQHIRHCRYPKTGVYAGHCFTPQNCIRDCEPIRLLGKANVTEFVYTTYMEVKRLTFVNEEIKECSYLFNFSILVNLYLISMHINIDISTYYSQTIYLAITPKLSQSVEGMQQTFFFF